MRLISIAAAVAISFVVPAFAAENAAPPAAPQGKPSLLRGTVAAFDGKTLSIKTEAGTTVTAAIIDKTAFLSVEARTFDQLKATDFIGVTSVPGKRGHLKAEEVHVIPMVGVGEGSYPWDHHPSSHKSATAGSMTNGTVQALKPAKQGSMTNGTVAKSGGRQLTVTYHGSAMADGKCVGMAAAAKAPGGAPCDGSAIVDVSSSTPIVAMVPAKPDDVKQGLAAVAGIMTLPDGKIIAGSVTVEKNGVKPEF